MNSEKVLDEMFKKAGKEHGFNEVTAEFAVFKEFKIRWQRSVGKADFKVSDYMDDAPPEVIDSIATSLFSKISGCDPGYPKEMNDWITSPEFIRTKQPIYVRRSRNLTGSSEGTNRDLKDSYKRLVEAGLVDHDPTVHISWTIEPNVRRVGYCSVLMKVIAISSVFDDPEIPDLVVDFVLYHELIHIMLGYNPLGRRHGPEFAREEMKYPMREEADAWLKKLSLHIE